jgi:hypothetical protein
MSYARIIPNKNSVDPVDEKTHEKKEEKEE